MCVGVCGCARERERDRQTDRQTDRQRCEGSVISVLSIAKLRVKRESLAIIKYFKVKRGSRY